MHFLVDVWRELFNIDVSFLLPTITLASAHLNEVINMEKLKVFARLKMPKTPSVCLLRSVTPYDTHVATYIDERLLHITETGVQFMPEELIRIGFPKAAYYEYNYNN
jgi:hypothetical protein